VCRRHPSMRRPPAEPACSRARPPTPRPEWARAGRDPMSKRSGGPDRVASPTDRVVAQLGRALRSGRRGREFKSPPPDHITPGERSYSGVSRPNLRSAFRHGFPRAGRFCHRTACPATRGWRRRGTIRYVLAPCRLRVDGGRDPIAGKRRQIERTLLAPNNEKGRRLAATELSGNASACLVRGVRS
jgi:hypothetical protein